MSTIYEGVGPPKIKFQDGTNFTLPEPSGTDKDGLRLYDFEPFFRDQYWSEKGKKTNVGKKFIFVASLKWISMDKSSLRQLWKAQKEAEFIFILIQIISI